MVATLVRLRFAVLAHGLRRDTWRVVLLVGGLVWALASAPSVLGGMLWLSGQPVAIAHDVLVVGGGLLVLGWAVVPILVPGLDDSLDIRRFATFGVPARRLVPGLLTASLLGLPTLATAAVCLAPMIAWSGLGQGGGDGGLSRAEGTASGAAVLVTLLAAPLALATCVLASRLSTGVAARLLGSRRSREISAVLGLMVAVAAVPLVLAAGAQGLDGVLEAVPALAQVLGWTPFGAAWAAPAVAAAGDTAGAMLRLAVALGWVLVALGLWTGQLERALVRPPHRGGEVRRLRDVMVATTRDRSTTTTSAARSARSSRPTRPAPSPGRAAARAVTLRALRYWTADPRYLSALIAAVVVPVVIVLLATAIPQVPPAIALVAAPLMAGTIGWGRHNDVAFDGSAFWLHVAAAVPGWADRTGRAMATLAWAAPLVTLVGVAGALLAGRPELVPASVGLGLGVLGAGLAVSAVSSALLVYPVPEPGANPYAAQMGSLGAVLVAQLVTSAATVVLSLPALVAFGAAVWWRPGVGWVALLLGVLSGAGLLAAGVRVGGAVLDRRAPRLLAQLG